MHALGSIIRRRFRARARTRQAWWAQDLAALCACVCKLLRKDTLLEAIRILDLRDRP